MKLSIAKDKVIYHLVANKPLEDLYKSIKPYTVQAALVELRDENYITIVNVSGRGTGNNQVFKFQSILPSAIHFCSTKKKFHKNPAIKWLKESWIIKDLIFEPLSTLRVV